jgi:predicted dehydrogenase
MSAFARFGRPLRLGFIGGAAPSMIGQVHLRGALMDRRFVMVAGALSRGAERSRAAAPEYGIDAARAYASAEELIAREAAREDGVEAVAIVTPNHLHHAQAVAAIRAGLDVMLDKPVANSLEDAEDIARAAAAHGVALAVAHAYSGYPMLREARAMVAAGALGTLRFVQVEYLAGGLAGEVEAAPDAGRRWRLDPAKSGPSLVLGDIGTHAHHLACFVAGRRMAAISAEVATLAPGRAVQDYATARFRLDDGTRGSMVVCQAAAGTENHILLRVFGALGHLEWRHDRHNELRFAPLEGYPQTLSRGHPTLSAEALHATRFPRTGHPEGLHEAFANLYRDFAEAAAARRLGVAPAALTLFPTVADGVEGLRFVTAALASEAAAGAWISLSDQPGGRNTSASPSRADTTP